MWWGCFDGDFVVVAMDVDDVIVVMTAFEGDVLVVDNGVVVVVDRKEFPGT